jgi:acyl-CoA synthetase (AMP-forming)/AMP-acid ligase II
MSQTYPADTIANLLAHGRAEAPAIGAPGRPWLSYDALRRLAVRTVAQLHDVGIGRSDRVAIVLPNGPEMAACFIAVASGATTAPLNPAYLESEFDFYLSDLGAKALVILAGLDSPARTVAERRGITILDLVPEGGPAGGFSLQAQSAVRDVPAGAAEAAAADDIALVLHTSGTTARPKIVPLSQRNITASAYHIVQSLELRDDDVCLNIMPLFHIHGLIAAVLASLAAGGAVCCAPGLNAFRFFSWFAECRPTWYTAVPTMHQTLLELAPRFKAHIDSGRLRFLRSSSASLPPQVMTALEETFGVPVLEAYGMTEAAHQMASNPLPPRPRYPGCVGIAAGPDVAVMDEIGFILRPGVIGEVVIRGPNVTAGYENNPAANASAFAGGWFRTGDQGVIDEAGYLRLTGRLKEIINRAGEKVAPLEVDIVLMDHPAVRQAVTFALPDPLMGEDVAAAVVLRDGETVDEQTLRRFVATRLSAFKVPRKIVFLAELPKGPTGKLQRIGLAEKLALTSTAGP